MTDRHPLPARRRLLKQALGGAALVVLGPQEIAWGAQLVAVRVWPADEYTRVTLESDVSLDATFFSVEGPDRLVIDIDGLELSPQLKELVSKVRSDDPFIAGVRIGQNRPKVVRLVLDLKQPIKPQVFGLRPVAAYQHRLVFDLYPHNQADMLAAQLMGVPPDHPPPAGTVQSSEQAADDINDALDEFIGKLHTPQGAPSQQPDRQVAQGDAKAPDKAAAPKSGTPKADATKPADARSKERVYIVALDAGHGGEDPGAIGPSGLYEKDVVLAVARKLRARINAQPGMRAFLTRESDYFVPLHERVNKARRVQADLFVSIHADAFMNPQARGASVFALSENGATSAAARWMAKRENASDLVGGVNIKVKDQHVMRALLDMSTTAQIQDSLKLGSAVLGHLGKVGRLHKNHVEQAGFAVLKAPDIPSILVETGFITNPEEEAKLRNDAYQTQLADALLAGIQRYFERSPAVRRSRKAT